MVTKLFDIFDWPELADMISGGFIRSQAHTNNRYIIMNYTQHAHNTHLWNKVTRQCRGLIYDSHDGRVVARPFPKFFNYGEEKATERKWSVDEPVIVTDKMDGSLGISYLGLDYKPCIATRGSFNSEQAVRGTKILREKYPEWYPDEGLTYLFEIIYPENRIVVNYGGTEDLILLGAVNIATGSTVDAQVAGLNWPGPVVQKMEYTSFQEALEAAPRENAEGVVVHFLMSDQRVKLKQDDYVELHRIVSKLDKQVVWSYLKDNRPFIELIEKLPEEFNQWILDVVVELLESYNSITDRLRMTCQRIVFDNEDVGLNVHTRGGRKHFAESVKNRVEPELQAVLFCWLDDNNTKASKVIWNYLKPAKEKP